MQTGLTPHKIKNRKLKIIFGILPGILLVTLSIKLTKVPGGMILPSWFLGGMIIIGIILGCLIVSGILKLIFKKISYLTFFFATLSFSFLAFHYKLYSPTLEIIVPNDYRGEVYLVLSNIDHNILIIDQNGIGYLNEWTFNKTYTRPVVKQMNGKNLDKYLIAYTPSGFFGGGKACCINKQQIKVLSFKIGTTPRLKDEYFESIDWMSKLDRNKVRLVKPDKYTHID